MAEQTDNRRAAAAGDGLMAQRKHGKHYAHGLPAVAFPARAAARRDRVPRVVVAARDLQPGVQWLQQLQLVADVAAWRDVMTGAAVPDPAAVAMLATAATAAADVVAAVPDDPAHREHRAQMLADVAWMDRAARRMLAVAARIGRGQ
jgi:hypothetical protein